MVYHDFVPVTGTNSDQQIDNGQLTTNSVEWILTTSGTGSTSTHDAGAGHVVLVGGPVGTVEAAMTQEIVMAGTAHGSARYRGLRGRFTFDVVDVSGAATADAEIYFIDTYDGSKRVIATITGQATGSTATVDTRAETLGAVYAWPDWLASPTGGDPGEYAVGNKIYVKIMVNTNSRSCAIDNVSLEMNTMDVGTISSPSAVCRSSVSGEATRILSAPTIFEAGDGSYKWFHDSQLCEATSTNSYGYKYGIPGLYLDADPTVIEGCATIAGGGAPNFAIGNGIQDAAQSGGPTAPSSAYSGGTTYHAIGNNDRATITVGGDPTSGCSIHINGAGGKPGFTLTEGVHWDIDAGDNNGTAANIKDAILKYITHPATNWNDDSSMGDNDNVHLCYEVNNTLGTITAVNVIKGGDGYTGAAPSGHTGIPAGTFIIGRDYAIRYRGTTDFTTIGSSSNTPGTVFTATGVGSGDGTAAPHPYSLVNYGFFFDGQGAYETGGMGDDAVLQSGTGFSSIDTYEANNNLLPEFGEVAGVRTGTCDATSTHLVLIDTDIDAQGRRLDQTDNFWIGGTLEITGGTGAGRTATITDSDQSSRSLTFANIGVTLDTTSTYRVTSVGTRGIASIAVDNAGTNYNMSIPLKGYIDSVLKDGAYTTSNVVSVLSPWRGGSDSATHYCDFVGDWAQSALKWKPHPRSPWIHGESAKGTIRLPTKTLDGGEKIPYYSYPVQHSKTLGATRQFAQAYPTGSGKVVAKASYVITVTGDSSGNLSVTAFTGSTASLVVATLPYRGSTVEAMGNGYTHQRNKFYDRGDASGALYQGHGTASHLTKLIVESTSVTHDLTAFTDHPITGGATTYWGEKDIIGGKLDSGWGNGGNSVDGFTDPAYTSMEAPLDYPHSAGDDSGGEYPYYYGSTMNYLLAWEFSGCEEGDTATSTFRHLFNQQGVVTTDSGYLGSSQALATTSQVFSTASGPTVTYGIGGEDGAYRTLLATVSGNLKPQGGGYTYRWIDTAKELMPTPSPQIDLNIVASGTPGGAGTFYEDVGPGEVDSGISPATVEINNRTPEYNALYYKFEFGWLDAGGTVFTGLSTTDWQGSPTVSNAPSTNTTGADATGSGVTNDYTDGSGGADLYTFPYNTANKYQLNCTSANEGNVADQILLFNSTIATSQGHPTYVEYIVKLTAFEDSNCPNGRYSNPVRIYRDLSGSTGNLGAAIGFSNDDIMENETITFHALDSSPGNSDASGTSLIGVGHTFSWDFSYVATGDPDLGHNNEASGLTVSNQYTSPASFQVRLLVTDFDGDTSAIEKTVVVNDRVGIPDEFVIQVYQTEALALEGDLTNALYTYENTGKLTIADNYYIYRDYWYRIESNDVVDGFYIDWDDGEDNSNEKSNSQTIMLKEPQFFTVIPHTYTKNNRFFPLVRAIKKGIYSKYYTNGVTAAQLSAQATDLSLTINPTLNSYTALETESLNNGNNEFSIVHADSFGTEQTRFVPFLEPRNLPPVGILKTDRNAVYAGIDNSVIGTTGSAQQIYLDDDTGVAEASDSYIEATVVYENTAGVIISADWNTYTNRSAAPTAVNKLLSIKLKNLLENTGAAANDSLRAQDRVNLKTKDSNEVVATVSLGSPYLNTNQPRHSVVADASESRTRGSNNSIASYYFTDGVTNAGTVGVWSSGTQLTDVYNSGTFAYTNSKRRFMYTFDGDNFKHYKDPDNRFYDYEMLIKLQVKDNHTDYSGYDRYYYSKIQDYNNDVYNTSITPDFLKRNSSLRFFDSVAGTWSNTNYNAEGTKLEVLIDSGTYGTGANNAFLLTDSEKRVNRLYFQVKHGFTLNTTSRDPKIRVSLMYSGKNDAGGVIWKSVPFVTTTTLPDYSDTGLYRSGIISFNMPEDWVKTTQAGITWESTFTTDSQWDYSSYGLLIAIEVDASSATVSNYIEITNIWPYDDEHVQLVTVQDPHHVSLGSVNITNGISFVRTAKNMDITDKLGRTMFKRMGVDSGKLSFGGIQLSGSYIASYDAIKRYQQNNTPVYLDILREDDSYIRFFGTINSMNENYPTSKGKPRFDIQMGISQVIEFDSSGNWLHDIPLALGGIISDEPKYTS